MERMEQDKSTTRLTVNAMLAALSAVLGYISISTGNLKFTFEGFPVLLAGLMYGPAAGVAVGGVGIFIYQVLRFGLMITTPLWILPYVAAGFIAGVYARRSDFRNTNKELIFIIFLTNIVISVLNSLMIWADSLVWGYYSPAYVFGTIPARFVICFIKSAAYGAVVPGILKKMSHITHNGR